MRRGLMAWNAQELPKAALDARIARLQAVMRSDGLDGFVLYTNLVQPSAVTFLTGFTPYWSDGLMLVPKAGAPVFATALSKRVANWIASTNPVSEIVNTPKPGAAIGKRLAADDCRRVGVLELDRLPGGLYDEITGAAPAIALIDASAAFAALRRGIDDAERKLIERADTIAVAALAQAELAGATDAGAAAGLVEKHARLAGAEEAYIAVAPDLDAGRRMVRVSGPTPLGTRFALRASISYKGSWVRRIRSVARDDAGRDAMARADAWFAQRVSGMRPETPISMQLAFAIGKLPGAMPKKWMAESTFASYPLQVITSSDAPDREPVGEGRFLVLSMELAVNGVPWLGAAPVFVSP